VLITGVADVATVVISLTVDDSKFSLISCSLSHKPQQLTLTIHSFDLVTGIFIILNVSLGPSATVKFRA